LQIEQAHLGAIDRDDNLLYPSARTIDRTL
jgi:hypothetical protein